MTPFEVFVKDIYWATRNAGGKYDVDTVIKLIDQVLADIRGKLDGFPPVPGKWRRHRIVRRVVAKIESST